MSEEAKKELIKQTKGLDCWSEKIIDDLNNKLKILELTSKVILITDNNNQLVKYVILKSTNEPILKISMSTNYNELNIESIPNTKFVEKTLILYILKKFDSLQTAARALINKTIILKEINLTKYIKSIRN
jgi:hypothetical protein